MGSFNVILSIRKISIYGVKSYKLFPIITLMKYN